MKLKKNNRKHCYKKDTTKNNQTHPVEVIIEFHVCFLNITKLRLKINLEMEESKTE